MSNLNKFKNSYQVFEKNPGLCFMKKNIQGFINNVSKKKLAQDFTIITLCANVYKMYECDKNQMLYCNVKSFKKPNFWEFWAIDRTWPTLDLFSFS
jgi:hypothetical protein